MTAMRSPADLTEAAVQALGLRQPRSECVAYARMVQEQTPAVVSYSVDHAEDTRRRHAGLGAITSIDDLTLLARLPAGLPVTISSLTVADRRAFQRLPHGTVRFIGTSIAREVIPPLEVTLAVVAASDWRQGLHQAGRFAPFCARAMVLPERPVDVEEACLEADFFGIGVIVVAEEAEPEVLLSPEPFQRQRFTPAGWRFLERTYRRVRWPERSSTAMDNAR